MSVYTVQVEDGRPPLDEKPSAGPVYRCIYAKDGLLELPTGLESPWEFFSHSVEKTPKNRMLGHREVIDGKAGPYVWKTYQEVYEEVIQVGSAIRSRGVSPGARCGIYGSNCSEWIITME
ncbi:Long-chain acyl-coa synthetase, partial [Thalictrum thalictroides]